MKSFATTYDPLCATVVRGFRTRMTIPSMDAATPPKHATNCSPGDLRTHTSRSSPRISGSFASMSLLPSSRPGSLHFSGKSPLPLELRSLVSHQRRKTRSNRRPNRGQYQRSVQSPAGGAVAHEQQQLNGGWALGAMRKATLYTPCMAQRLLRKG